MPKVILTKDEELAILYLKNFRSLNKYRDLSGNNPVVSVCIEYWNRTGHGGSGYTPVSVKVFNSLRKKKLIYADFDFPHVILYKLTDTGKKIGISKDKLDKSDPLYNQTTYGYQEWYDLRNPKPIVKLDEKFFIKSEVKKKVKPTKSQLSKNPHILIDPFSFNPNRNIK